MLITKEFTFDMAHRLPNYNGKCSNIHGHTYKIQVTIKGDVIDYEDSPDEGMLVDFVRFESYVRLFIDTTLDHHYLSDSRDKNVTDFFVKNKFATTVVDFTPTAENMAEWIFNSLDEGIRDIVHAELYSIKVWETPTLFAEFRASSYKDN